MIRSLIDWLTKSGQNFNLLMGIIGFTVLEIGWFFCLVLFAASSDNWKGVFATLAMIAAAAYGLGLLIGFLFGIPRTLQGMPEVLKESALASGSDSIMPNAAKKKYMINTNLEQVSDWLTKIIVGVGLVEFGKIKDFLGQLSTTLAADMIGVQYAKPFIAATILSCLAFGFMAGYLITRLWLSEAFAQAEEDVEQIHETVKNLVNLDLDLKHFTSQEAEFLKAVINRIEKNEVFILPEEFTPHSEQHKALELLERRYLVKVQEGGGWESGKAVELTPIAQKMLDNIKQELSDSHT